MFLLLLFSKCKTEILEAKHWSSIGNLFSKAPKVWFSYVEMICRKVCQKSATFLSVKIPLVIKRQTEQLQFILKKATENVKFTCKERIIYYIIGGHNRIPPKDAVKNYISVYQPLGNIMFTTKGHSVLWYFYKETYTSCLYSGAKDPIYAAPVHVKNCWEFKLLPSLTINFTFLQFKIKCVHGLCTRGNISVVSDSMEFLYCGEHSKFAIYPQYSPLISLILDSYSTLKIVFQAYFSILPSRVVSNIISLNMSIGNIHKYIFANVESILLLKHSTLYTVHVQVNKYQILNIESMIYTTECHVQIFDGPGTDSDQISQQLSKNRKQRFSCKSFQAVIQYFTSRLFYNETSYFATATNIFKVNIEQSKYLFFPSDNCLLRNHMFCVFQITVDKHYPHKHLNISFLHLSHGKNSISGCKFAGLATYKPVNDSFAALHTLCKVPYLHGTHQRNLYSNTRSLLLVIYSYPEYANISGVLQMTTTACTSINVDICAFAHFCLFYSKFYHADQCQYFFNHINSLSGVKFQIDRSESYTIHSTAKTVLTYSLEGKCIILQARAIVYDRIKHHILDTWTVHCEHVYLKARETSEPKYFNYRMTGCVDTVSSRISKDRLLFKSGSSNPKQLRPSQAVPCFDKVFRGIMNYFHIALRLTKSAHSWLDLVVTSSTYSEINMKVPNGMSSVDVKLGIKMESTLQIQVTSRTKCKQSVPECCSNFAGLEVSGSRKGDIELMTKLQTEWKTHFCLYCTDTTLFISVPGKYRNLLFKVNNTVKNVFALKLKTIDSRIPTSWECSYHCSKRNLVSRMTPIGIYHYDERISRFSEGAYLFLLRNVRHASLHQAQHGVFTHEGKLFQSWNTASNVCLSLLGHLPEFKSQKILVEFLTLLKLNPAFENPVFASLYIGLKVSNFMLRTAKP